MAVAPHYTHHGCGEASKRVAYSIVEKEPFTEIRFSGVTSIDELIQLVSEVVQGGRVAYPRAYLVDLTGIEHTDIDYETVTQLFDYRESLTEPDRGARIAILASEPHLFGMARMVELRTSAHERTARAFHAEGREEAEAWLAKPR